MNFFWSHTGAAELPTVELTSVTQSKFCTAVCTGNITDRGSSAITERGFVWSTAQNPTINDNVYTDSETGIGEFSSSVSPLTASTTYYFRAYAINSVGIAYSDQVSITTLPTPTISFELGTVTSDTIPINGTVTLNGNESTAVVIYWGTTESNLNNIVYVGVYNGTFSYDITGLDPDTLYYYKICLSICSVCTDVYSISTDSLSFDPVYASSGSLSSGTGSTASVSFPSTVNADDILVMITAVKTSATFTTPSGWTKFGSINDSEMSYAWYWKRATGSESGTQSVSISASGDWGGIIYRYSDVNTGSNPSGSVTQSPQQAVSYGGSVTGTTGDLGIMLWVVASEVSATGSATGWDVDKNTSGDGFSFIEASYKFGTSPSVSIQQPYYNSYVAWCSVILPI